MHDLLLLREDEPLLFLDLTGDRGARLGDLLAPGLLGLLPGDLLVELDAALALLIQPLDVLELLLLPRVVLLSL